jgi:hypothetical protein
MHRESLATTELFPGLSEVMDTVLRTVNCVKASPLKSTVFAKLCEEMGSHYQSLLFCCHSRCLSRGNVVVCVHSFRDVALFIQEENLVHAEHFRNE